MTTENHELNTPDEGTLNWDEPINENFRWLDTGIEVRDNESNLNQYTPESGAKFLALDTGRRFIGDGSSWNEATPQPRSRLTVPQRTTDPEFPNDGQVWYREDLDEVKVNVGDSTVTLAPTPTEPADTGDARTVIPFDSNDYRNQFNAGVEHDTRIVDAPARNGKALAVHWEEGESFGTSLKYDFKKGWGSYQDEAWCQYWLYVPEAYFDGRSGSHDKWLGWRGVGSCGSGGDKCTGNNGWSARGGIGDRGDRFSLSSYVYEANMDGDYGDHWDWGIDPMKGEWHRIDQHMRVATEGRSDGLLETWVNGEKGLERDIYTSDEGGPNKIESLWFNTWRKVDEYEGDIYVDTLKISDQPIDSSLP